MDDRSEKNLIGVHPDLVKVVRMAHAATQGRPDGLSFVVTCGRRTIEEQRKLVAAGASQTMQSRHLPGPDGLARAVDLAATLHGEVHFDWPLYHKLREVMADNTFVPLVWGGTWKPVKLLPVVLSKTFPDGPHFELDRLVYP